MGVVRGLLGNERLVVQLRTVDFHESGGIGNDVPEAISIGLVRADRDRNKHSTSERHWACSSLGQLTRL